MCEHGGDGVRGALDGEGAVRANEAHLLLAEREALGGQTDEQLALGEPGLVGDEAGRAVGALVDAVEPDADLTVQVVEALEARATDKILFKEKEEALDLTLSIGVRRAAQEGLEAGVAGVAEELRVPNDLARLTDRAEHDGRHAVEDDARGDALEVLEAQREPLDERCEALVQEEAHVRLPRRGEQDRQRVDDAQRPTEHDAIRRPICL